MGHFSEFFTAILFLICALLIEQLAVAQNYGPLLGSDESDYDFGPQDRGADLSQEGGEVDDMDNEPSYPDGIGNIENDGREIDDEGKWF